MPVDALAADLSSWKDIFYGLIVGYGVSLFKKIRFVLTAFVLSAVLMAVASDKAAAWGKVPYMQTMEDVYQIVGNSKTPVLIQFDAVWCGYCKALQPHIQKLYDTTSRKRLQIYKVDIDRTPDIAAHFGVSSLPTLFIVHEGKPVDMKRGGMDERTLFDWVNRTLERT